MNKELKEHNDIFTEMKIDLWTSLLENMVGLIHLAQFVILSKVKVAGWYLVIKGP